MYITYTHEQEGYYDCYQLWGTMQTKPKLRLYRLVKSEYKDEPYTSTVNIFSHHSFLARLRGGTTPLATETGRYVGVPAEERTCHYCYEGVVDEIPGVYT